VNIQKINKLLKVLKDDILHDEGDLFNFLKKGVKKFYTCREKVEFKK
jgi:hypothetical protein